MIRRSTALDLRGYLFEVSRYGIATYGVLRRNVRLFLKKGLYARVRIHIYIYRELEGVRGS